MRDETALDEDVLSLAQAARLIPSSRAGRPTAPQTLSRWITAGARGPDGKRVRLEGWRLGGRWVTSVEALDRFMTSLTPRQDDDETPLRPSNRSRRRDAQRAARQLDAAGIA